MTNKYYNAFEAAQVLSAEAKARSDANQKLAARTLAKLKSKSIVALLNAANVDTADMRHALYAEAKAVSLLCFAVHLENKTISCIEEAFRTAMLCARNNVAMRRSDIDATLLINKQADEDRAHLIFNDRHKIEAKVQVDYSIKALEVLKIAEAINSKEFKINVNAIAQAVIDRLQLDMSAIEVKQEQAAE